MENQEKKMRTGSLNKQGAMTVIQKSADKDFIHFIEVSEVPVALFKFGEYCSKSNFMVCWKNITTQSLITHFSTANEGS